MRQPRSWCLSQEKSTPSQAGLAEERPKPELERQALRWAWERDDWPLAMPRWKRKHYAHRRAAVPDRDRELTAAERADVEIEHLITRLSIEEGIISIAWQCTADPHQRPDLYGVLRR